FKYNAPFIDGVPGNTGYDIQESGLARPIGAEEGMGLTTVYPKVEVLQNLLTANADRQIFNLQQPHHLQLPVKSLFRIILPFAAVDEMIQRIQSRAPCATASSSSIARQMDA